MRKYLSPLVNLVACAYVFAAGIASLALAMVLAFAPTVLIDRDAIWYVTYKIVTVGPCLLIAYALWRRRKWGLYLLVIFNGALIAYQTFSVAHDLVVGRNVTLQWAVARITIVYVILGGLIVLAFQRDVKALVSK